MFKGLVVLVGLAGSATGIMLIPRDAPPAPASLQPARQALETAVREEGRRWAPRGLGEARTAIDIAERLLARERARLPLLRDYARARDAITAADEASRRAVAGTRGGRDASRAESEAALAEADGALTAARSVAEAIRIGAHGRSALKKAEIALLEAHRYHGRGAYEEAAVKARWVAEQSAGWERRSLEVLGRFRKEGSLRVWRRWIADTIAWSASTGESAIVVDKATRTLLLYQNGRLERSWQADLGRNPIADKLSEGDNATPEGKYSIARIKGPGQSRYHRAFLLNYPNEDDWEAFRRARREGRIPRGVGIGSLIEIHGEGGRGDNWTRGCVALSNRDMDYLASRVRIGTPVTIVGAREPLPAPKPRVRLAGDHPLLSGLASGGGHR